MNKWKRLMKHRGGRKERNEHGGSSMTNCVIHGEGSSIFD
jgi:hypothetical protein